jgi:hypothetical protein
LDRQISLSVRARWLASSIFEKTRTRLRVSLAAAWYLTNQKQGVSALGLQRVLALGSYQTAWTMLHRFRHAMVRHGREQLKGLVELHVEAGQTVSRGKPLFELESEPNRPGVRTPAPGSPARSSRPRTPIRPSASPRSRSSRRSSNRHARRPRSRSAN